MTASATSVQAGGTILYRITAYTNTANKGGKLTTALKPSATTPAFSTGSFVLGCDTASGATCSLASVRTSRPSQPDIEMQVTVPKNAPAGETIKFSATLSVTPSSGSAVSATASAPTVTVAKAAASPSASRSKSSAAAVPTGSAGTDVSGATATVPGLSSTAQNAGTSIPIGDLPAIAGVATTIPGVSTTIPGGNASSLFPKISPSAAPSPAPGTQPGPKGAQPVAESSRIPLALSSSEFGAQIVGLIVLLLGVAIAVTRLSIRKARPSSNK